MKQARVPREGAILRLPLLQAVCLASAVTLGFAFSACGGGGSGGNSSSDSPRPSPSPSANSIQLPDRSPTQLQLPIRIAVSLPLFQEFARTAGGDNVEVISLIPQGADPHTYQLKPEDIARMKGVDFFFLNGLGLDSRLQDVIEANRDEASHVIPFAPNINSPTANGRTAEQAGDNAHLWLDPTLASVYVEIIVDELDIYDGIHKDTYDANFRNFQQRMTDLQNQLTSSLKPVSPERRKLITYHDSFQNFARRFGFQVAGFAVPTPADSPPAGTASRLSTIVQDGALRAIFAETGYDAAIMQEVATSTGATLCTLATDMPDSSVNYEDMMRANTAEIVRCLGG